MLNAIHLILLCLLAQVALTDLALRRLPTISILTGLLLALFLCVPGKANTVSEQRLLHVNIGPAALAKLDSTPK